MKKDYQIWMFWLDSSNRANVVRDPGFMGFPDPSLKEAVLALAKDTDYITVPIQEYKIKKHSLVLLEWWDNFLGLSVSPAKVDSWEDFTKRNMNLIDHYLESKTLYPDLQWSLLKVQGVSYLCLEVHPEDRDREVLFQKMQDLIRSTVATNRSSCLALVDLVKGKVLIGGQDPVVIWKYKDLVKK